MPLSNKWNTENTIYKVKNSNRVMDRLIYRANGFEAFVIAEDNNTYTIEGNGVKCKVWKKYTKSKIKKVSNDYQLRSK